MDSFDEIAKSDSDLRAKAIEQSTTLYELEIPKKYKINNDYLVIFIFHGGGSNLQKVMNHWSSKMLDKNFIKVYLQSYRCYDSGTFGWKSGDERADSDILKIYKEVSGSYRIDSTRIYVAGISAGATYAIDMAFRKVIPVSGIIAFCPGLPQDLVAESLEEYKPSHMKAYIVSGENDYYQGTQRQMTEIFDLVGFEYKHLVIDDMGHQYPKNENFYIDQGIKYIENYNE
jgi:poly(3-hydroxybutyrate) depolymerase